jgi:hypothetical protein
MNALFEYSLLKYVHSISLGEGLNVGILFFFPESGKLIFKASSFDKRVKGAFPSADILEIKSRLQSFAHTTKAISGAQLKGNSLYDIIANNFQIWESSPLVFNPCNTAQQTSPEEDLEADLYEDYYFSKFLKSVKTIAPVEEDYFKLKRRSADHVLSYYQKLISEKSPTLIEHLNKPKVIRNEHSIFVPDVIWQNGTLNAVKAISLDLSSEIKIIDQALLLHSKLNYLKEQAEVENIRFDILVGKPVNHKWLKDYENAIEILQEIKAPKLIVEETEIESYSEKTVKEAEI